MTEIIDKSRLRALSPFDELKESGFQELRRKIELHKAKRGETLFRKGDTSTKAFYVLSGVVELRDGTDIVGSIKGGTDGARFPIAPQLPRQQSAIARKNIEYICIDSELLDLTLTWDQTGIYEVGDIMGNALDQNDDWMTALLRINAFQSIPPANIQTLFARMQQVNYKAGDIVVRQEEVGDYFYVVNQGHCIVTRETELKPGGIILGELNPGDTFGEEALITNAKRNATVSMTRDGTLMRLGKDDFRTLLSEPALDWVDHEEAVRIVADGGKWLDVRLPGEFKMTHKDGAVNLPLYLLRLKLGALDTGTKYVVCCDTGRRSSAAAFILSTKDFDTTVLWDGLNKNSVE
jgi:CRP-like cAMP-binding protein